MDLTHCLMIINGKNRNYFIFMCEIGIIKFVFFTETMYRFLSLSLE